MSESCCGGNHCHSEDSNNTNFWNWWRQKAKEQEVSFTLNEVLDILGEVKEFNAGAIDSYLSNHIDRVMKHKIEEKTSG